MAKVRADQMLVERGLAPSRERARALILGGKVYVGEKRVDKAGDALKEDVELTVRGDDIPYVSRGGVKIAGALDAFQFDPRGLVAADFGASTGGFTDCLLQRGATRVYAIDVGYGQLHQKLRTDARVVVMERVNARHLTSESLPELVDVVVIDASFIGLGKLLPAAVAVLKPAGEILAMVKPQFEVGKKNLGKNGVVREESVRVQAIDDVAKEAAALGLKEIARADCVITGPEGNREAFLRLERGVTPGPSK